MKTEIINREPCEWERAPTKAHPHRVACRWCGGWANLGASGTRARRVPEPTGIDAGAVPLHPGELCPQNGDHAYEFSISMRGGGVLTARAVVPRHGRDAPITVEAGNYSWTFRRPPTPDPESPDYGVQLHRSVHWSGYRHPDFLRGFAIGVASFLDGPEPERSEPKGRLRVIEVDFANRTRLGDGELRGPAPPEPSDG